MDAWNAATPDISTVSRRLRVFPSSGDEARIQSMSLSWVAGLVCWDIRQGGIRKKRRTVEADRGRGLSQRTETVPDFCVMMLKKGENRCARVFLPP